MHVGENAGKPFQMEEPTLERPPLCLVAVPASGRKVSSGGRGKRSATRASRSSVKVSPTINRRTAQDTVSDDKRDLIMGA